MKVAALNVNKFNLDVNKKQTFKYIDSVKADLFIIQEYCLRVKDDNKQILNPLFIENEKGDEKISDKRVTFIGLVSENNEIKKYKIDDNNSKRNYIALEPTDTGLPSVLGVHLTKGINIGELKENVNSKQYDIVLGDFNTGLDYKGNAKGIGKPFYEFYKDLVENKGYCDLWEYALSDDQIEKPKAYFIDALGEEADAEKDTFYRTFSAQRRIDYILCKKDYMKNNKCTKIVIDYRTLAFTDHCAVIAEFDI